MSAVVKSGDGESNPFEFLINNEFQGFRSVFETRNEALATNIVLEMLEKLEVDGPDDNLPTSVSSRLPEGHEKTKIQDKYRDLRNLVRNKSPVLQAELDEIRSNLASAQKNFVSRIIDMASKYVEDSSNMSIFENGVQVTVSQEQQQKVKAELEECEKWFLVLRPMAEKLTETEKQQAEGALRTLGRMRERVREWTTMTSAITNIST